MQTYTVRFHVDAPPKRVWRVLHPPVPPNAPKPRVLKWPTGSMEILNEGDDAGEGLVRTCVFEVPKYLLSGGSAVMITMQGGNFVPVPFVDVVDPDSGRARVRMVDIHSTRYGIARRYMIRLRRDDFEDPHELAKFAATAGISLQQFRDEFEYLIAAEPPPLIIDPGTHNLVEAPRPARSMR